MFYSKQGVLPENIGTSFERYSPARIDPVETDDMRPVRYVVNTLPAYTPGGMLPVNEAPRANTGKLALPIILGLIGFLS